MMNDDVRNLWKSGHEGLAESILLNPTQLTAMQRTTTRSTLQPVRRVKIFTFFAGVAWAVLLGCVAAIAWTANLWFMFVSALLLLLLNGGAVVAFGRQLRLLRKIDMSESVLQAQEKLAELQSTTLNIARWLFLQLPLWTTFYINDAMVAGPIWLWIIQLSVTVGCTILAIWLFRNIHSRNAGKKWFRYIFRGPEWQPIIDASRFLTEIENYEKEP